jgi:hypothetical protein
MGDIADWYADRLGDDAFEADEPYHITYIRLERETEKAWLLILEEEHPTYKLQCWFPKSQCEISVSSKVISVPYWLVKEKDLEDLV